MGNAPNYMAAGDIYPCRFVKISDEFSVSQAGLTELPDGISQANTRDAPIPNASTLAAADGEPVQVYGEGDTCLLEAGEAFSAGDLLKPDGDGKGIAMDSTSNDSTGAKALADASAAGELVRCVVQFHKGS